MQTELLATRHLVTQPVHIELPDADVRYYADVLPDPMNYYQRLLREIDWRQDTITIYGRPVPIPRMNAWYGDPGAGYSYSGLQLQPLPWTPTLATIKTEVENFLGSAFNSVLANYYRDGRDSVAWHSDDEFELGDRPLIASVSLGAARRFSLRHRIRSDIAPVHLPLQSGSLLVMGGSTQRCWQHQLPKTQKAIGGRINLTFRRIMRTRS